MYTLVPYFLILTISQRSKKRRTIPTKRILYTLHQQSYVNQYCREMLNKLTHLLSDIYKFEYKITFFLGNRAQSTDYKKVVYYCVIFVTYMTPRNKNGWYRYT